ncbi:protein FAM13B isoform X2 [Hypomesus transpacificus]|uniref:protein FAM13B isoform X2 n=1 Tax=Hypomesus transpacificus TaxID=137520 RepID=UPI001F0739BE|nr:protein FAM13B isoform X2 [Hypomesus transpacificus]
MRKSVSPSPGSEALSQARVFGIPLEELKASGQSGHSVPLLVQQIVDYIEEHGRLDLEGMFFVNGNAERVDWLRQRYDNGEQVDLEKEADLASAVSLLRLFLQKLPEPIIPAALQALILQLYQDYSSEEEQARNMKYLLQQLPQVNYALLRFLCRFLSSVASLQEDTWNVGALAAVFGPDIFHLDTEVESLREQESVSRILAELLENKEDFFDSEDDDISTTNDYSSINEQITELLDDDKLEACEELPQDSEDRQPSDSTPHTRDISPSSSHIPSISILPGSANIIERTIRAAVEQHFLDLKTCIDSSYNNQGAGTSEKGVQSHGEEGQSEGEDLSDHDQDTSHIHQQDEFHSPSLGERSGMDLDVENNTNTARQDGQSCENMDQADNITRERDLCENHQNSTSDTCPASCQHASSYNRQLHLGHIFPDSQWEAPHAPFIDFSFMHMQKDGCDPVPAFKSWHDESDSGEAQLSPLAGRMVHPPLEEDAHPLLARRFLDFGHSQRFLLQDPDATSPTKSLSCGRPRRASFGSKDSSRAESTSHQLSKKLQNLKKKIKQFEDQFEKDRNYKPSHGDKAANPKVLKWMTDLTKIRKQIKGRQHPPAPKGPLRHQAVLHSHRCQLLLHHHHHHHHSPSSSSAPNTHHSTHARPPYACRQASHLNAKHKAESEQGPLTRPRSNTLPKSFGSTLEAHAAGPEEGRLGQPRPTRLETLELIQLRVLGKREEDGWPEDTKMSREQLSSEKTVLQKNLLHYEGLHGRPVTREERLVAKPLYDRYRLVKQMLTRASITPITVSPSSKRRSQTLQPIIEGETAHFCDEIEEEEEEGEAAGAEEAGEGESGAGEEEEEGDTSGGEMQSSGSDIIMSLDPLGPLTPQSEREGSITSRMEESSGKLGLDLRLSSSNASSMPELLEQLWKARAEKKKLRKTIREFEDVFYQQNGRTVQKEDRVPMLEEYKEYKRIKAKLRLVEVLISKQDSSKSI